MNTSPRGLPSEGDDTFNGLVRQARSVTTAAFANQDIPFERIVSSSLARIEGMRSRNPLIQVMFALHSQQDLGHIQLEGLAGEPIQTAVSTRLDMEFHLFQKTNSLSGHIIYATDLFEPETIDGLVGVFQDVLQQSLDQPQAPVATLPLTTGLDTLRSMGLLDIEKTGYPRELSIVDIFRKQVSCLIQRLPPLSTQSSRLTYTQLDRQSDELDSGYVGEVWQPKHSSGVSQRSHANAVGAFFSILKANLAYLPLDINTTPAPVSTLFWSLFRDIN